MKVPVPMIAALSLSLCSNVAVAAEIHVLCAGAARGSVVPLIEPFQRESGHTIRFDYGTAGQIQAKLTVDYRPEGAHVHGTIPLPAKEKRRLRGRRSRSITPAGSTTPSPKSSVASSSTVRWAAGRFPFR